MWRAAALKFELPDVTSRFAVFAVKSLAPQSNVPLDTRPIRRNGFPVAGVGQGHHCGHTAAVDQWRVLELGEGATHRSTRLEGPFGDRTARPVRHITGSLNAVDLDRYVETVVVDCPLRRLFRANGARPAEADHTRTDRDPEPAGLRFHTQPVLPARPWLRPLSAAAEATKSGLGKRSPRASAADSSASTSSSTASRTLLAHITSPLVPAGTRPTPLPPSDRPLPLSRPAALAASDTRGLPASAAPAVFRLAVRVVVGPRVGRSAAVLVGRGVDPVMLGIGYLLPGSPRRASLSDGR